MNYAILLRIFKTLAAVVLAVAATNQTASAAERAARPNIVFILVDDLRVGALSCEGNKLLKTPHIDRIAREGALFRNAFVTTPLCSPARASFLTGQYVHTHGIKGNTDNTELSHKLVTFPLLLQQSGYETAYVGKWHMGNNGEPRPGFDHWVGFRGQGVHFNPTLNVNGETRKFEGYMADILSEQADRFLRKPHEKPFCLYLSHKAVHGPFEPAPRHADLIPDDPLPQPPNRNDDFDGKPALRQAKGIGEIRAPADARTARQAQPLPGDRTARNQLRMLQAIDEGVGRLLKTLEDTGRLDSTLIVFTSDNGFFWGEHRLGDKRWAYEESIRIPMLMRFPKLIKPGRKPEGLALNVDIAPTFLEIAGVPVPEHVQGRSLMPLMSGKERGWRDSALFEYFKEERYAAPTWQAVRTDRWKYIYYPNIENADELYDLKKDPYELNNLVAARGSAKQLKELKVELARLLEETSDTPPAVK